MECHCQGKSKYSDKNLSQFHTLSTTNPAQNVPQYHPDPRGKKPAINLLSHGMTHCPHFLKASDIFSFTQTVRLFNCHTRPPTAGVCLGYLPSAEIFKVMHDSRYCILWAGFRKHNGSKLMNHYQAQRCY
jgi:hypothetical protein